MNQPTTIETSLSPLAALRQAVKKQNFVILDTETTGLQRGEICQIAILNRNGDILLDTLIKPVSPIPLDAELIHGISNDAVANAMGFAQIMPVVREICTGRDVIAYNAVFDRKMLHQSAEAAHIEKTDWKVLSNWICAMEAYAEFHGDWNDYHQSYRWQKLAAAAAQCGIGIGETHHAAADCLLTLAIALYITANEPSR